MQATDSNMDLFLNRMLEYFAAKERADYLHEPDQVLAAQDDLKIQLLKLQLVHDTKLSKTQKMLVDNCAMQETAANFKSLVKDLRQGLDLASKQVQSAPRH